MANMPSIPVWKKVGTSPAPATTERHPAVVVGAGPVGLTVALDLARHGHPVVVLAKLDFIAAGSKAICFSKRTLDVWGRLGVARPMVDKGVIWNVGKVFWGDSPEPVYQFDMLPVKNQQYPGFINLQQYYAEDLLLAALSEFPGVDIRWGHEVTDLRQDSEQVEIGVTAGGSRYALVADYVIACDGNKSKVRELLHLDFEGRVFEENFLIADIRIEESRPLERWFWFDPPFNRGQSALLHKQPDNVWRLDFQLGWNVDRQACTDPAFVDPLVRGMLGPDIRYTPEWYSVYTFQCRRMKRFVHDRVIFAGDSAHLVSPFGARGCNGGIADADNLVWKLDLVLRGEAPVTLLETYNYEAITTADENILNSSRSTDFLTPKTAASRALRDAVLALARHHAFARPFVNSGRLSTPVSYPDSPLVTADVPQEAWAGVAPGSPALDAPLGSGWLLDRLGGRFVLLANGYRGGIPPGVELLDLAALGRDAALAVERFDLTAGAACLLRPDQYVAARWRHPDSDLITAALSRARGLV